MNVVVGVPTESVKGESRVALDPHIVESITNAGYPVCVEKNAGQKSYFSDSDYSMIPGVSIVSTDEVWKSDLIIKIQPPSVKEAELLKKTAILICSMYSHQRLSLVNRLADRYVTTLAMEMLPRITRAQAMDTLSTQATVAGYRAVIRAAERAPVFFPMLTYAAGSIRPAKVLVIGVGVAGLQAIATAKRLGAQVEGYDVRPETREQVESLGAKFVHMELDAAGEGGYARELSAEEKAQQQALLAKHISLANVVITTASIPGKPAPKIISTKMIAVMEPGSVIIDLAAESGGNTEITKPGKVIQRNGVIIDGMINAASGMPLHASQMYAKNMHHLLLEIFNNGKFTINRSNEVITGCLITHQGKVVHPAVKSLLPKPAKTTATKKKSPSPNSARQKTLSTEKKASALATGKPKTKKAAVKKPKTQKATS